MSAPRQAPAPSAPAPSEREPIYVELELARGEPAVVSLPAPGRRPVLVATHGAGGRAEVHCQLWRAIVKDRAFVVCPRGHRMSALDPDRGGYFYDGHPRLAAEIEQALAALVERFGDRVDLEGPIYAGYSQGAGMGSMMLPDHPARFRAAVLMEGGFGEYQEWNVAAARRFRENGARRVLFACGRVKCFEMAKTMASYMRRAGLEARVIHAEGAGHTYGGELHWLVGEAFRWVVEGDSRW